MWCCPFPIYICGIKLLNRLHYWSCFRHCDKSGYFSLYIQFYNCCVYGFVLIFFLNLGFYYNAVEYRHKYLNTQHISIKKNPCFIVYQHALPATPAGPSSVTSRLSISIQPVKSSSPIRVFYEKKQTIFVFSVFP